MGLSSGVKVMQKPERVVVIGASAGGIDALTKVVAHLPYNLQAAVILIQHLTRDHQTKLHEYLARRSALPVCLAEDGLPLEEGVVYVSIPGCHLKVKHGCLSLVKGKPVHHIWPSADLLFSSAAREYGSRVISVVLTGTGRDGAEGCKKIKEKGGLTIASDEKTSYAFGMPQAAIELGAIDYVLPLEEIAGKIVELVRKGIRVRRKRRLSQKQKAKESTILNKNE